MNTPNANTDFFIGISAEENNPKITAVGRSHRSMENVAVRLGLAEPDEGELTVLKGKIDDIVNPKPYVPPPPPSNKVWPPSINDSPEEAYKYVIDQQRKASAALKKEQEEASAALKKEQEKALAQKNDNDALNDVFSDDLDRALEVVKEDQATKSAAVEEERKEALAQKNADIKNLDNKREELLSAIAKANKARIAIVNDSLVSKIPRGPLPIAVSRLKDLQANNANNAKEAEIKIVKGEIEKLKDEAEVYEGEENAARNALKSITAEIRKVMGSGKKTKRRRNKRRKTKRRKTKRSKK